MGGPDLTGKRVLVLGAETELGSAIATALAEAGATIGAVASTNDPEAAFAVQRLARRLSLGDRTVVSQAIDATNEKAVQVMVRQVSKELGGLSAVVDNTERGEFGSEEWELGKKARRVIKTIADKEFEKRGGGCIIGLTSMSVLATLEGAPGSGPSWRGVTIETSGKTTESVCSEIVAAIAGPSE